MKKDLEVKNISKKFNGKEILKNISFDVYDGEFLSILGASGCGKTKLLRILIGIETADSGEIIRNNKKITNMLPSQRGMGIVFQNYALFPNMTVLENVAYPLKIKKGYKKNAKELAIDILKKVGLEDQMNKYPNELSGGKQQRTAIARTLALNSDIILFDEPMSALDADNRLALRKEFKEIQKKFNITMIYITHDQEEAFSLSDRVMVMKDGKIEQLDTPNKIFNSPKTEYVKKFVKQHLIDKVSSIENCTGIDL